MSSRTRISGRWRFILPAVVLVAGICVMMWMRNPEPNRDGAAPSNGEQTAPETTLPQEYATSAIPVNESAPNNPGSAPLDQTAERESPPESSDPSSAAKAMWKQQIERKLLKFEQQPLDLDVVYELARESIIAQLDLGLEFHAFGDGEQALLIPSPESHVVSRVSAQGSRVYAIPRSEYPKLWEILRYFESPPLPNPDFPAVHVSKEISDETATYARDVIARLSGQ